MKRLPNTPKSQIRSALRKLFLRSRERSAAIKRDGYTCCKCHRKQSKAKGREISVEVHHIDGVTNWDELFRAVYSYLLCHPDQLVTLCPECHKETEEEE
jgi:5-methylcytosine-specific restriction endonuclease McrA